MSGWFGTSNRDTNNALDGIRAGHVRRRNMQRQRYDSGIFGRRLGSHAEGHTDTHNETYRGFSLTYTQPRHGESIRVLVQPVCPEVKHQIRLRTK